MKPIRFLLSSALLGTATLCVAPADAGIGKWFKRELVPTLTGERPLQVKPYVSVKHHGKMLLKVSPDAAYVGVGGVTVKTHQLKKRLAQAGCVIETGGNVIACAPDIVYREVQRLAQEERSAARSPAPRPSPSQAPEVRTGWAPGWTPHIVARCQMADGALLGVSAGGYIHAATPTGMSSPVGFVRRSRHPLVRFVLDDGRGVQLPVDQMGRVLHVAPWGQVLGMVGVCR